MPFSFPFSWTFSGVLHHKRLTGCGAGYEYLGHSQGEIYPNTVVGRGLLDGPCGGKRLTIHCPAFSEAHLFNKEGCPDFGPAILRWRVSQCPPPTAHPQAPNSLPLHRKRLSSFYIQSQYCTPLGSRIGGRTYGGGNNGAPGSQVLPLVTISTRRSLPSYFGNQSLASTPCPRCWPRPARSVTFTVDDAGLTIPWNVIMALNPMPLLASEPPTITELPALRCWQFAATAHQGPPDDIDAH